MKKLIAIVAITASVMATPAFAQSFNRLRHGQRSRFPGADAEQTGKIAGRQSGLSFRHGSGTSSAADSYSWGTY